MVFSVRCTAQMKEAQVLEFMCKGKMKEEVLTCETYVMIQFALAFAAAELL